MATKGQARLGLKFHGFGHGLFDFSSGVRNLGHASHAPGEKSPKADEKKDFLPLSYGP